MEEKPKRKNDEPQPLLIRVIGFVLMFLGLFIWIAPTIILCLMILAVILQLYHPILLLIVVPIIGFFLAIPVCIGIIYFLATAFSKREKRKRGE
jgi:hypothetical protein